MQCIINIQTSSRTTSCHSLTCPTYRCNCISCLRHIIQKGQTNFSLSSWHCNPNDIALDLTGFGFLMADMFSKGPIICSRQFLRLVGVWELPGPELCTQGPFLYNILNMSQTYRVCVCVDRLVGDPIPSTVRTWTLWSSVVRLPGWSQSSWKGCKALVTSKGCQEPLSNTRSKRRYMALSLLRDCLSSGSR